MLKRKKLDSGQAMLELAIFGALSLVVVGALVNYGLMISKQQELDMYAFRRALQFSQARYHDNKACREASFTASQDIYPVNLLERSSERQQVTGSGVVNWETDSVTLDGEDPDDYGKQYWQWGAKMKKNYEAVDMPRMLVKRRKETTEIRGFIAWITDFIRGTRHKNEVWQGAPIEQTIHDTQKSNSANEGTTEYSGMRNNNLSVSYQDTKELNMLMKSNAAIKQADSKVISVLSKPGDITIDEQGKISKSSSRSTLVK